VFFLCSLYTFPGEHERCLLCMLFLFRLAIAFWRGEDLFILGAPRVNRVFFPSFLSWGACVERRRRGARILVRGSSSLARERGRGCAAPYARRHRSWLCRARRVAGARSDARILHTRASREGTPLPCPSSDAISALGMADPELPRGS
jgi:hypothetical protein